MSGGSYDYIYLRDLAEDESAILARMRDRLHALQYDDAANEIDNIVSYLDRINHQIPALRRVMRAVEWHDSGDSGIDTVDKAIREWRNAPEPRTGGPLPHLDHKRAPTG